MKNALDSQPVEIPCPHCGYQLRETIAKLKTDPKLTCGSCKGLVEINAADLRRKIAQVEKALADFTRKLGRLGK